LDDTRDLEEVEPPRSRESEMDVTVDHIRWWIERYDESKREDTAHFFGRVLEEMKWFKVVHDGDDSVSEPTSLDERTVTEAHERFCGHIRDVAEHLGVTRDEARTMMELYGLPSRRHSSRTSYRSSEEETSLIREMYDQWMNPGEIAERIGSNGGTVRRRIITLGLEPSSRKRTRTCEGCRGSFRSRFGTTPSRRSRVVPS